MDEWRAIGRGAAVAGVALVFWAIVLALHNLSVAGTFVLAVVMAMPFLALGARVEGDGDLSSPRRRGTLVVFAALAIVQVGILEAWEISGWLLSPVLAVAAWFAAGGSSRPDGAPARPDPRGARR